MNRCQFVPSLLVVVLAAACIAPAVSGPPGGRRFGVEPALEHSFQGAGFDWIQCTSIHGGRGYVIWMVTPVGESPQNRPINDEFLETFEFTA